MEPKRHRDSSVPYDATPSKIHRKFKSTAHEKLCTDPELKPLFMKIIKDPAYRRMGKQIKYLCAESTSKKFDWEVYLSAAKQYLNNKEVMDAVERVRNALEEDPSKPGEERIHPAYRAIIDEIMEGGHAVRERYFTEPEFFRKYVEAIKLSTKCGTTSSDDVTSLKEVDKPEDVKESTVDQKIHEDSEIGLKNAPDCGVEDMQLVVEGGYRDNVMETKNHRDLSDTSIPDDVTTSKSLKTEPEFKFPNKDKLHYDPEFELMEKIKSDPAFIQMMQLMSCLFHDSTADQFNEQAYFSAAKQYISNLQYMADAKRITNAMVQNDSKRGDDMIHIKDAPTYNSIVDEIKAGGLAVLIRYLTDKAALLKLVEAIKLAPLGDNTSPTAGISGSKTAERLRDEDEWLKTANLEDPNLKAWIELAKDVGAHESSLHLAAFYGRKMCVEYLLENGADALLENSQGLLPIELAEISNSSDVVELLDKHFKSLIGG